MSEKRDDHYYYVANSPLTSDAIVEYGAWLRDLPGRLHSVIPLGNWHVAITIIEDEPKGGNDAHDDSRPQGTYLSSS